MGGVLAFLTGFITYWLVYLTFSWGWPGLMLICLIWLSYRLLSQHFSGGRAFILMLTFWVLGAGALAVLVVVTQLPLIGDG